MSSSDGGRSSSPDLSPQMTSEQEGGQPSVGGAVPFPQRADERSLLVWRQWLSSMATDAEAALAAAIAYREMDGEGRERWVSSLSEDAPQVTAPAVALCAPLLAVETDGERRQRLVDLIEHDPELGAPRALSQALTGTRGDGLRVYVLATPLYLDFVQVLACGVQAGVFAWVRHDPIVLCDGVPKPGQEFFRARLEPAPVKSVLDELAVAILSHQKSGASLPEALKVLGDLLGPLGP